MVEHALRPMSRREVFRRVSSWLILNRARGRACHGPDLKGLDAIPGIAGRSPSYLMRQLHDFQTGARAGTGGDLMKPIVEKLSTEQLLAIAAYVASLNP